MGFFNKIKSMFKKEEETKENITTVEHKEEVKETQKYVEGLSKSRENFY